MERGGGAGGKSRLNVPDESPSRRSRLSLPSSVNASPLRRGNQQLPRPSGSTDMLRDALRAPPALRLNGTDELPEVFVALPSL